MSYTKQTFTSGQILKASDLNTMSQGIYEGTNKSISILFVGNSLTQDAIAYLPYVLKTYHPEIDFKLYMWFIGGKALSDHYANFTSGGVAEIFSVAENNVSWTNYSGTTAKTMSQVLSSYTFDVVCMQEYFNKKTEYLDASDWDDCRDYIVSNYQGGNALEFVSLFHAPWRRDGDDIDGKFALIEQGNALILQTTISQNMIPTGLAVYRAMETDLDLLGDKQHLSSDGVHTQEGLPCLLQTYVALCWLFEKLGINKSIYGSPMRMTAAIYNTLNVPGANLGSGVIEGTTAQNLLAQEVAIKTYKESKQFVMKNLSTNVSFGGGASDIKYTFTIVPVPSDATVVISGVEQKSVEVQAGGNVSWSVSKDGYITQSGVETVNYDMTKTVTLAEAIAIDEATQAYIDATGIGDVAMVRKLDTMVTSLKSAGLWDKIDALYPCVGSTFDQMSYNLKDVSKYKLSATKTPTVTKDVGFYSDDVVSSDYNANRLGTDFHVLGVAGNTLSEYANGFLSICPSSLLGKQADNYDANNGFFAVHNTTGLIIRTGVNNNWMYTGSVADKGLFVGSLSSGIVYNGTDMKASKKGTPNLTNYPDVFVHNGSRTTVTTPLENPFQVRLSGFGAALTITEMQTYSAILNEFKSIY